MHPLKYLLASACALFIATPALAQESEHERILSAVREVIRTQFDGGENAAIAHLQSCYQGVSRLDLLAFENCAAKDIAYANLSAGMYRGPLKALKQPEYVTMEALRPRLYGAAQAIGMTHEQADTFLRRVAPIAIASLTPAIQSRNARP